MSSDDGGHLLEDMALLGLVNAEKGGHYNSAWSYRLSDETVIDWPDCLPEVSGVVR